MRGGDAGRRADPRYRGALLRERHNVLGGSAHDMSSGTSSATGTDGTLIRSRPTSSPPRVSSSTIGSCTMSNWYVHDNYWDGIWCDHCDHVAFVIRDSKLVQNGRSGIDWEVSGDAVEGDHALIKNNKIRNNGWNTDGTASPWAGIIISDSSNIEIVGNTFGGNDEAPGSGGKLAIHLRGERNPQPMHDVYIHDNVLNGDWIWYRYQHRGHV